MDKLVKSVRAYTTKVVPAWDNSDYYMRCLEETHRLYVVGVEFFLNLWLNICGCMQPDWVASSNRSTYTYAKELIKKDSHRGRKDRDNNREEECDYHTSAHCFVCWFTLESKDQAPKDFIVKPEQIPALFRKYWSLYTKESIDPDTEIVLGSLMKMKQREVREDEPVWVDRHRCGMNFFADEKKSNIERIIKDPNFPLKKGGEDGASKECGNIVSAYWGQDDKKSNWAVEHRYNLEYERVISKVIAENKFISRHEFILQYAKAIGVCDTSSAGAIISFLREGKKGGPFTKRDVYIRDYFGDHSRSWLRGDKTINILDELPRKLKEFKSATSGSDWRADNIRNPNSLWIKLKEIALKQVGCPWKRDHYVSMMDLSIRRLRSYTSNFYNKFSARAALHHAVVNAEKELKIHGIPWLITCVKEFKKTINQEFLNGRQLNCFDDVLHRWVKDATSLTEATKKAQSLTTGRFGDAKLFQAIGEEICIGGYSRWQNPSNDDCRDLNETLKAILRFDQAESDLVYLRWNYLRHISESSPQGPEFGKSKPCVDIGQVASEAEELFRKKIASHPNRNREIEPQEKDYRPHHFVNLSLYNGSEFEMVQVPFYGHRLMKEVLCGGWSDAPSAPRNHAHFLLKARAEGFDGANLNPQDERKYAVMLDKHDSDHWGMRVSVTFESPNIASKKNREIIENNPDLRVLAIDLGQRNAGYWALLEKCRDSDFSFQSKKGKQNFRVIESGPLEDLIQLKDRQPEMADILDANNSAGIEGFKSLWECLADKDRLKPKTFEDISYDLSWCLKRHVRERKGDMSAVELLGMCNKLLGRKNGLEGNGSVSFKTGNNDRVRGQGGLSFKRIDRMNNICQAVSSQIGLLEKSGSIASPELINFRDNLRKKINNCKQERIRRTQSAVIKLAITKGVQILVIEKLGMKPKSGSSRFLNKRAADWCPIKVCAQLEQQCNLMGIYLKAVAPQYTSIMHWPSRNHENESMRKRSRYVRVEPHEYDGERWHDFYIKLESREGSKAFRKGDAACLAAWRKFFKENSITADQLCSWRPKNVEYLPSWSGKHYYNEALSDCVGGDRGYIDADLNAAVNIGLRGLEFFFGTYKKESR